MSPHCCGGVAGIAPVRSHDPRAPSPTWRLWTNVAHYVWVVQSVLLRRRNPEAPGSQPDRPYSLPNLWRFLRRVAIPHAHGVYANALSELHAYSAVRWRRVFQRSGLVVDSVVPAGVFYSGYKILVQLDVPARKRLAKMLGSSCNVFVLTRKPPAPAAVHDAAIR